MAQCTCANPQAVANAINQASSKVSKSVDKAGERIDKTLHGAGHGGRQGVMDALRFCHWAAPEYGPVGENAWSNFFKAAQIAIATLNATIQGQIADKQQDLAEGYYQQAKYKWDRFDKRYRPLEEKLLQEVSTVPVKEMDCADDRARAEVVVNSAYDIIGEALSRKAKAEHLCIDPSLLSRMAFGRSLMLADTENYNLRDDTWFVDFKNDQRWNRRGNVLNLGRNLGSMAMKYGDVARSLMNDVSGIANKAFGSISTALGYYGARFDTVYPTTYLGTNGQSGGIVSLAAGATNPAAAGGGLAL